MWCLGRYLPFFIGDKIPDEYPYWENYDEQLEEVKCFKVLTHGLPSVVDLYVEYSMVQ